MRLIAILWAALAISLGAASLGQLSAAYSTPDLTYDETPVRFGSWLLEIAAESDASTERPGTKIAQRLVRQPIIARRNVVLALLSDNFWGRLASEPRQRNRLQRAVLAGVEKALKSAPADSSLWLLAARLHFQTAGFDARVASYLNASFLYGLREHELIGPRLRLSATLFPLLPEKTRQKARLNLAIVDQANPALAQRIRARLQAAGATP